MADEAKIEKFTPSELESLRNELLKSKRDSWQTADIVSHFLAGRGYGVDQTGMRNIVPRIAFLRGSQEGMQAVLEAVAYVM